MAKRINEGDAAQTPELQDGADNLNTLEQQSNDPVVDPVVDPVSEDKTTSSKPSKSHKGKETEVLPESVSKILKAFPQYESLYLDMKGGVFTSSTPESIRGNAKEYQNPHFIK